MDYTLWETLLQGGEPTFRALFGKGNIPGKARRWGRTTSSQSASDVFVQHGFHDAEEVFQGRLECRNVTFVKGTFAQVRQCNVEA